MTTIENIEKQQTWPDQTEIDLARKFWISNTPQITSLLNSNLANEIKKAQSKNTRDALNILKQSIC